MLTLKEFILEEKNTHMEHLEDLIFNEGVNGTRRVINYLRDLRDMLAGQSTGKITATVKWDGAPAVFAGIDPRDGKFFVAKKSIFNVDPKVYKTPQDVDADCQGDLAVKMKMALSEFAKLGIKGVIQGDLMFTHDTLKTEDIDGKIYVTFHPNTIVYAVPAQSPEARRLKAVQIGVVWHTTYTGTSFANMTATFGRPIVDGLNKVSSVWMMDATYHDYSGTATFTKSETADLIAILSQAGYLFNSIDGRLLDSIHKNTEFLGLIKTYNNSRIKNNQLTSHVPDIVTNLFHYIYDRYQKDIDSKKTAKGKQTTTDRRDAIINQFTNNRDQLINIYTLAILLAKAKHMIVEKMSQASSIETFVKTSSGFKLTNPEGFVAIDHLSGGAVKLVNRMEFSKANFSAEVIKGWKK